MTHEDIRAYFYAHPTHNPEKIAADMEEIIYTGSRELIFGDGDCRGTRLDETLRKAVASELLDRFIGEINEAMGFVIGGEENIDGA